MQPVQQAYTSPANRSRFLSDINIHRTPIFRHRESSDELLLIMINNNAIGHAGFMIGEGNNAILYDPAGSYTGCYERVCEDDAPTHRGSGDYFPYPYFDWEDYLAYHRVDGPKVSVYEFIVPQEQAQRIRELSDERGGASPLYCATAVTDVLKRSGGEFSKLSDPMLIRTPWGLEEELKNILYPGRGGFISPAY